MKLQSKKIGSVIVVSIDGDIDALTSDQVTKYIYERIKQEGTKLIIDLNRVNFMSSAGLRMIIGVVKKCRNNTGDMCIAAPQPGVAKVLKMSGFENIINFFESSDLAAKEFNGLS